MEEEKSYFQITNTVKQKLLEIKRIIMLALAFISRVETKHLNGQGHVLISQGFSACSYISGIQGVFSYLRDSGH